MGKEADIIHPDATCTPALGRREVGKSGINAYVYDP